MAYSCCISCWTSRYIWLLIVYNLLVRYGTENNCHTGKNFRKMDLLFFKKNHPFYLFLKFLFTLFLFTWKAERKIESEPPGGSLPKCLQEPGLSQSGIQSRVPTWVVGTKITEPSALPSRVHIIRKPEWEAELGHEFRHSNVGCWHPERYLTCYVKCPLLDLFF